MQYVGMQPVGEQIDGIRGELGSELVILGHHYQRSSVLKHADELGDSLELSRKAADSTARRIVFCGVKFMAESADVLSGDDQVVYMPETGAGCPMADMVDIESMAAAWEVLTGVSDDWIPVVYVNSSAEVKAFCGRNGGLTCTSSNAVRVFEWAFAQGKRVFFLPDEHLGANTAVELAVPDEEIAIYDASAPGGGVEEEALARARIVLWKGFCLVHTAFSEDHIRTVRERLPEAKIIVHPEVPKAVAQLADERGSTAQIIKYVEAAPDGATIVIGTELNLVQRLAEEQKGRIAVKALSPSVCANMAKTNEKNLLALLQGWDESRIVRVPPGVVTDARLALERMLGVG